MEKTKQELLKEANDELSQACFERGRLLYEIKQDEEEIEKKKIRALNMEVDFKKVRDKYRKALKDAQEEMRSKEPAKKEAEPTLEGGLQ